MNKQNLSSFTFEKKDLVEAFKLEGVNFPLNIFVQETRKMMNKVEELLIASIYRVKFGDDGNVEENFSDEKSEFFYVVDIKNMYNSRFHLSFLTDSSEKLLCYMSPCMTSFGVFQDIDSNISTFMSSVSSVASSSKEPFSYPNYN